MTKQRVVVVDGPVPDSAMQRADRQPQLHTSRELEAVAAELLKREPIFHRREFGLAREDFERMTAPSFWEVGASGRRYGRTFVLDVLEQRYESAREASWEIEEFNCQELGPGHYLATYTLHDEERPTSARTCTILVVRSRSRFLGRRDSAEIENLRSAWPICTAALVNKLNRSLP